MESFFISAKFLGTQVEWSLNIARHYTVGALWADVFMFTCATLPEPTEKFRIEAKLPWSGQYFLVSDDDKLQELFQLFRDRGLSNIRMNVELLSNVAMPDDDNQPTRGHHSPHMGGDSQGTGQYKQHPSVVVISSDDDDVDVVHAATADVPDSLSDADSTYNPNYSTDSLTDDSEDEAQHSSWSTSDTEKRVCKLNAELGVDCEVVSDSDDSNQTVRARSRLARRVQPTNTGGPEEVEDSHGDCVPNTSSSEAVLVAGHDAGRSKVSVDNDGIDGSSDDMISNAASFNPQEHNILLSSSDDEVHIINAHTSKRPLSIPYQPAASGKVELRVGHLFRCHRHFKQVFRDYVVQEGFNIERIKNARYRFTAKCAADGCNWRIHASSHGVGQGFKIKTLHDRHACIKVHKIHDANAEWVAQKFGDMIREHPDVKVAFLQTEITRRYGVTIPTWTLRRAKSRVLNVADQEHTISYNKLYSYGYVVRAVNPGSAVFVKTVSPPFPSRSVLFQRFFLSFQAQKHGFLQGCRPFLAVDGCHLKGRYPGVILAAVALDANNGIFPVAFCIAEAEDKYSWGWFLEQLYNHIGYDEKRRITFMSDRQKGLLDAIPTQWPNADQRHCVRHLIANLQKDHKGDQIPLYVWKAANASNERDFNAEMEHFKQVNKDAHDWMRTIPLKRWTVHQFETHVKTAHTTNNAAESFNGWIDKHRGLPALHLAEHLRRKMMKRMHKRWVEASKWNSNLPPAVMSKLAARMEEARYVTVLCASNREFEVKDGLQFEIVKLDPQTCSCGLWEVTGIPCKHALAVFSTMRMNASDFVHWYLTKDAYLLTYGNPIHPIPSQHVWPEVEHAEVLPPVNKRKPGRPKKVRRRGPGEQRAHKRSGPGACSRCGVTGHNLRTCGATNPGTRPARRRVQRNARPNIEANVATQGGAGSGPNVHAVNGGQAGNASHKRRMNFEAGGPSNARAKGKGQMRYTTPKATSNVEAKRRKVANQSTEQQTANASAQTSVRDSQPCPPADHHGGGINIDWGDIF